MSVVDVGCGTGEFLAVFQKLGVSKILGIDGKYVDHDLLSIPQENFRAVDLSHPFTLEETYDLAICLEVAEHLTSKRASDFVRDLTLLAPVILFSAAIPFQRGDHHVNEQWPEYWAKLFRERGYVAVDALRKRIWDNHQIQVWYRQNAIFFCTEQFLADHEIFAQEFAATSPEMLSIVHPQVYLRRCDGSGLSVGQHLKMIGRRIYENFRKPI